MTLKTLVICSGGLDSVTLAHQVAAQRELAGLISFDYGQRHHKELDFAARAAVRLGVPHTMMDISQIGAALSGSALTNDIAVPDGHYTEQTMKITIVPNRNAIMLTIAYGIAAARGADAVSAAFHGGDHFIYPDCRPDFVEKFAVMQDAALEGMNEIELLTPFLNSTKAEIVSAGAALYVPFAETWSCYKGSAKHCGRCGTCVERREAFDIAHVPDPTDYADENFWREAIQRQEVI